MDILDTKFCFTTNRKLKLAANAAAQEAGLSNAHEFMRIALQWLVENRAIPEEFKGRRAVVNVGRPMREFQQ